VDGKTIGACLGDLYSVKWMEDSDLGTSGETLQSQYEKVKVEVNKSHSLQFGDTTIIAAEPVDSFQGTTDNGRAYGTHQSRTATATAAAPEGSDVDSVDSRNIEMTFALNKFLRTDDEEDAVELMHFIQVRIHVWPPRIHNVFTFTLS
jgi:hypothetical protein